MKTKEFIDTTESMLEKAFPDCPVRLFPDPDDDATFFAYIFCVPDGTEREVKKSVRAFVRSQLGGVEWDVIPSIKNLSTTREHYPQYLRCSVSEKSVSNAVVFEAVVASSDAQKLGFVFSGDDFEQMIADHCDCMMPIHSEFHEGKFNIAA